MNRFDEAPEIMSCLIHESWNIRIWTSAWKLRSWARQSFGIFLQGRSTQRWKKITFAALIWTLLKRRVFLYFAYSTNVHDNYPVNFGFIPGEFGLFIIREPPHAFPLRISLKKKKGEEVGAKFWSTVKNRFVHLSYWNRLLFYFISSTWETFRTHSSENWANSENLKIAFSLSLLSFWLVGLLQLKPSQFKFQ